MSRPLNKWKMKNKLSFVIPAYNEADNLEKAVKQLDSELKKIKMPYEILVAEQASTDGTDVLAKKMEKRFRNLKHIHFDEKGKGNALTETFANHAKGNILAFMDADLATDISYVGHLIANVQKGADVSIGSRNHKDAIVDKSTKRKIISAGYMALVKLLFRTKISDLQCGFKAFKKKAFNEIAPHIRNRHLSWDSEVLLLSHKKGHKIVEFPVKWSEWTRKGGSSIKIAKDSLRMGAYLFRLWWRLLKTKV